MRGLGGRLDDKSYLKSSIVSFFFISIAFIFSGFSSQSFAASWQASAFLRSLNGSVYNFNYLVEGLNSVHAIQFNDGTTAQYQSFFNRIVLSATMNDGSKRIKGLENLSEEDLGTIAHEAFHAFKANIMDVDPRFKAEKIWFKSRAHILFSDLKASKRETALEEAYAVFIGSLVTSRAVVERLLKSKDPNKYCKRLEIAERLWNNTWKDSINGYYYRDGIGEYWADTFSNLWKKLSGNNPTSEEGAKDHTILTERTLQDLDKKWIAGFLLKSHFVSSFEESMGSEVYVACR